MHRITTRVAAALTATVLAAGLGVSTAQAKPFQPTVPTDGNSRGIPEGDYLSDGSAWLDLLARMSARQTETVDTKTGSSWEGSTWEGSTWESTDARVLSLHRYI